MRKERVVELCICLVLLGSLQAQRIAGWPRLAAFSLPEAIWAVAAGEHSGIDSLIEANLSKVSDWRSSCLWTFVCAGWPPPGLIYRKLRLMRQDLKDLQSCKDKSAVQKDPALKNKFKDATEGAKANVR